MSEEVTAPHKKPARPRRGEELELRITALAQGGRRHHERAVAHVVGFDQNREPQVLASPTLGVAATVAEGGAPRGFSLEESLSTSARPAMADLPLT